VCFPTREVAEPLAGESTASYDALRHGPCEALLAALGGAGVLIVEAAAGKIATAGDLILSPAPLTPS
jgi:hypothetical protein